MGEPAFCEFCSVGVFPNTFSSFYSELVPETRLSGKEIQPSCIRPFEAAGDLGKMV